MTLASLTASGHVRITLELTPGQAAGLARFADKVGHSEAMDVLYPHVARNIRSEQASEIIAAFAALAEVLAEADVSAWPWIDTGRA